MNQSQVNRILNDHQVRRRIERIAYEIYENNHTYASISLVGIMPMGYTLAEAIANNYNKIGNQKLHLYRLTVDKHHPVCGQATLDSAPELLAGAPLILVDDVLNTGRTLLYALQAFYQVAIPKIQVAVMVCRDHKLFPISPDFVGIGLSTTLQEHVEVTYRDGQWACYLHS